MGKRMIATIKYPVNKEYILSAAALLNRDGKEVEIISESDPNGIETPIRVKGGDYYVPNEWLQEIKGPMTFGEWFEKEFHRNSNEGTLYLQLKKCHEWTIENEKLKREGD